MGIMHSGNFVKQTKPQNTESAFSAALDPNGRAELTIAAAVSEIRASA
jgi:hypothetical protein